MSFPRNCLLTPSGKMTIYQCLGSPLAVWFLLPQNSLHSIAVTLAIRANCKLLLGAYHVPRARHCASVPYKCCNHLKLNPVNYPFNYYPYFTDKGTEAEETVLPKVTASDLNLGLADSDSAAPFF